LFMESSLDYLAGAIVALFVLGVVWQAGSSDNDRGAFCASVLVCLTLWAVAWAIHHLLGLW